MQASSIITNALPLPPRSFDWSSFSWLLAFAIAPLLLAPGTARAQTDPLQSRIHEEITDSRLTVLAGQTRHHSSAVVDQGRLDPVTAIGPIVLSLKPTDAQQSQLDALLDDQQNPLSPRYHHWLAPEEFGAQFGVTQSDLDKITSWLTQKGLTIVETAPARNSVTFVGPSGSVESAFHTEIHQYLKDNAAFHANSTDPYVPSALADVVLGFIGLDTYPVHPANQRSVPQPLYTSGDGSSYVSPADFAVIYDLNPLYTAVPAIDGAGQIIAVAGSADPELSDMSTFQSAFGLPANPPVIMLLPGDDDPGPGNLAEATLDLEWSDAVAPNATILFVNSTLPSLSFQYAIAHNLAPILSYSFGNCESDFALAATANAEYPGVQQAAAQGITIFASSGDSGSIDCEPTLTGPTDTGLSVNVPASFPYVTGVGGTEFSEGTGFYWNFANSTTLESALSYIPEVAWHDGLSGATGGGVSIFYAKPAWQTGVGVPDDNMRDVPDVAFPASSLHDGLLIVYQGQFNGAGGTSAGTPAYAGLFALLNQYTNAPGQGNINYTLYAMAAAVPDAFHDITAGDNMEPCVGGTPDCPKGGGSIGYSAGVGYDQVTGLGSVDANTLITNWLAVAAPAGATPWLSAVQPASIAPGSRNFTLTASGSGFSSGARILWNGSSTGVTMHSGGSWTSLQATIASSLIASAATAVITVTNAGSPASAAQNIIIGSELIALPSALTFSIWPVGATPAAQTVTLTNNLSSAVTIGEITLTGGSNQFAHTNKCGATLASGASCSITVSFTPLIAGSPTAKLSISNSASASSLTVSITGTVTRGTPILTWPTPSSFTYGTLLSATQLDATSTVAGPITYTPAANTMPAASSVSLLAAFTPTDATDYAPNQLTNSLTVNQASSSVKLSTSNSSVAANTAAIFTATVQPQIAGVPTGKVTFYDGSTSIGSGTLTNGAASISISSLAVGPHTITAYYGGDSNFTSDTSPKALTQTITAQLTISPLALNFSTQPVGATPATQTVTVANNLGSALAISRNAFTGASANQFAQTSNCGATLASGDSCSIIVTFTPLQVGAVTAQLSISDNAPTSPQIVTITGAVTIGTPTFTWPTPSPITYGTLLSATQLDPTASVPGTFTYTPASGTMPAAGSVSLLAAFTPKDATDYAPAQVTRTLTVNQASTNVIVATSNGSVAANTSVKFTATVQPQIGGVPTGTVTFYDGSTSIGPGTVSNGAASVSTSSLAVGTHNITAYYGGDANFTSNTSVVLTQTITDDLVVSPLALNFSLQPVGATSAAQTVTLANSLGPAVTISGITLTGPGENQFAQTTNCGATLASGTSCSISVTFGPQVVGSSSALLSISDSATNSPQIVTLTGTATTGTPTLTWLPPLPITYGTLLSATQLDPTASVPGTFTYTPASGTMPAAGSVSLLAAFTPKDAADYATAQSTRTLTVTQASTNVIVATSNGSVAANTSVKFTATVQPQIGGVPTGTVTFYDGSSSIGPGTVSNGAASVSTTGLAVGTHNITAYYGGDTDFTSKTSAALTETITDDLVVSPLALNFSLQPVGATSAAQTVTLTNNLGPAITISGITLTGAGANQFATTNCGTTLASGTSCSIGVTFGPQVVGSSSALLSISDSATNSPQIVTLTGTTTRGTPTLTWPTPSAITYGTLLSATQLDPTASVPGTFTYTPAANTMPAAGSVSLLAAFTPTDGTDYAPTQLTRNLSVMQASSSVALTASSASAATNAAVVFTATVQPQIAGSPTGTVTFYDGSTSIGTGTVSASAPAMLSIASLAAGVHSITAAYSGDMNFTANTSTSLTETITAPPAASDFTFTVSGSATETVSAGQTATFQIMPAPTSGSFADAVTFAATGLPIGATATFSPTTLPAGSATPATAVTMTVRTAAAAHLPSTPAAPIFPPVIAACLLLILTVLAICISLAALRLGTASANFVFVGKTLSLWPVATSGRSPFALLLALMFLSAIVFSATGCGKSAASTAAPTSTSYSIVVTANSGTVSHAVTVTLVLD